MDSIFATCCADQDAGPRTNARTMMLLSVWLNRTFARYAPGYWTRSAFSTLRTVLSYSSLGYQPMQGGRENTSEHQEYRHTHDVFHQDSPNSALSPFVM